MNSWDVVTSVALKAGEILKKGFRSTFDVEQKGTNDLITEYDLRAQSYIVDELSKFYPGCGFFAEENLQTKGDPLFVVDPLDGTNNFAVGLPQFCVSIGVVSNGNLTFGVVYNPILEELFIAQSGMGAFLNGTRLHVSQQPLHSTLVATAFPFKVREKVGWYNQLFNAVYPYVMDIRRMGSAALDMMYTVGGIFGLYFEYGINPWDVSAGVLAVQEAGGVVLDFSGQPYDLFKSRSIIAGSRENVELVINAWGDLGGRAESH